MGEINLIVSIRDTTARSNLDLREASREDMRALLEQIKVFEFKIITELVRNMDLREERKNG